MGVAEADSLERGRSNCRRFGNAGLASGGASDYGCSDGGWQYLDCERLWLVIVRDRQRDRLRGAWRGEGDRVAAHARRSRGNLGSISAERVEVGDGVGFLLGDVSRGRAGEVDGLHADVSWSQNNITRFAVDAINGTTSAWYTI